MSVSNQATTGPHAKEMVRRYFRASVHPTAGTLLQWLEMQDLIIVPKRYTAPARRGNDEAGPLIGKSHTAALIGGRSE